MKFVSSVSIVLRSGKGGDGIISWRREDRVKFGGPAGGSGGDGGSVYIESDENLNSLFHIRHLKFLKAKDGENGRNKSQYGRSADDLIVKVPCGTVVMDKVTNVHLADLKMHGQRFLCCKGGKGGRGNESFKSSVLPAPYLYELGDPYEEREILLDLKTIADVGFLGKPNAGKSSLLSVLSNAKPKIADFPFTTLVPVLGSVSWNNRKLVFADIPGLIENSSSGCGLGFDFLKHLSRCKILLHIVDVSSANCISDIESIEKELKLYSEEIYNKPRILVFNKMDLVSDEHIQKIKQKINKESIFISALSEINLDLLLSRVFDIYDSVESPESEDSSIPDFLEFSDEEDKFNLVQISNKNGMWIVNNENLKYWVYKIPRDTLDNIARLSQKLEFFNINKELDSLGAKKGDIVDIYGWRRKYLID